MAKSIPNMQKRRGRPPGRGKGRKKAVLVAMTTEQFRELDAWIGRQPGTELSRPEAIRRLVEIALAKPK